MSVTWKQGIRPKGYAYPSREPGVWWVNEIFQTIQGEGARAGTPATFLRLARCNLRCLGCDTEFDSYRHLSTAEIQDACAGMGWVVLTGGEPTLQDVGHLARMLHVGGHKVAIETNGTKAVPPHLDWITVSPKVWPVKQKHGDELKVVLTDLVDRALLMEMHKETRFAHYFLSPEFTEEGRPEPESLRRCIEIVEEDGPWRLSLQTHKFIGKR